ncbi:hypothetical protein ACAG26_21995 [Mycobacterium sp. pUA109]|uniref:hypothetical protein n=1 Tax=Mycobacterium sp. pUA109 TaxID=3238982 RepID=UPI00351ABB6F
MRNAVLVAVLLLVAGCSRATVGHPESPHPGAPAPSSRTTTATSAPVSSTPPDAGAPVAAVIAWVEAGRRVDAAGYHSATRDGATTELGDDIGFTTPADATGETTCMTEAGALACLVDLTNPPPRPQDVYGAWQGNWVDFDGSSVQVGSAHADPGPFLRGDGPGLPYGAALAFGDYRCRADPAGLICVNYAHRSAARFSAAGITPFGCLHPVPTPPGVGKKFSC